MGFLDGLMRGLGNSDNNYFGKSGRAGDREILDMVHDEDDELLSSNYRRTAVLNSDSKNGWYKCPKCGKNYRLKDMDADHIVPKSKGGDNSRYNMQLLCYHCNRSKNNKTDDTDEDLARRYEEMKRQDREDLEYLREARKVIKSEKRR